MPIIPATQEPEIERIMVQGHSEQKVSETPILTNKHSVLAQTCDPS
jgi:hypothetical protein